MEKHDLPASAVKRLAVSGCVGDVRVSEEAVEKLIEISEDFIRRTANQAEILANHAGRKTIKGIDIKV